MKILLLALSLSILFPSLASADMDDYYKYVDKYTKDRNAFLDLKERAKGGDAKAQSELASMYFDGRPPGLPANIKKAYKWYKKAAEGGDAEAQYRMGFFSMGGLSKQVGEKGDGKKVKEYLEKSAESGYKEAQKMLAGMNVAGDYAVKKRDLVTAYKWAGLAVGEGEDADEEMENIIKELENMMTESELRRAKGKLKRAISKRDAGKGGSGSYGRSR